MQYVKIENGQVIQVGLPTTGTLTTGGLAGSTVSGYHLLEGEILLAEGWRPLVDNPPEHDAETEYLEHAGYTIGETEVVANYIVKQREHIPVQPSIEQQIQDIQIALAELYGMGV